MYLKLIFFLHILILQVFIRISISSLVNKSADLNSSHF